MNVKLSKIRNWSEPKAPNWDTLGKIQKIRMVQSTYVWIFIVPILAKVLSKIEDSIEMVVFGQEFKFLTSLPFSWWVFYFAAISFSLANVIFIWRCPSLIKDHSDLADFRAKAKSMEHLYHYLLDEEKRGRDGYNSYDELAKTFHLKIDHGIASPVDEEGVQKKFKKAFWHFHDSQNVSRDISRYSCLLFYIIGFILISIVLGQNLWVVLKLIF